MIPKIIHYIWVGKNPMPKNFEEFYESWQKHCPDYEIKRWDESNLDINSNQFAREAYKEKKWAFVSDYFRLQILYNHGGVYVDTDVEILKPIDHFLKHDFFSSFEDENYLPTALMGAKKHSSFINYLLSYYDNRSFYLKKSYHTKELDLTTNVQIITRMTNKKYNIELKDNGILQILGNNIAIYPQEYFCPKSYKNFLSKQITNNSHAIHHFNASWVSPKSLKSKLKTSYKNLIGEERYYKLKKKLGLKIRNEKYK